MMGCFNAICNLSGLPVYSGDKVLVVLTLPSHKGDTNQHSTCYSTDLRTPAALPLHGEYDHYGSAEKLAHDPHSSLLEVLFQQKFASKDFRYGDRWYKDPNRPSGMEGHVKDVSRGCLIANDYCSESPMSLAFVLVDAYKRYLRAYDPHKRRLARFRADADAWFSWYGEVLDAISGHKTDRDYLLTLNWGRRAMDEDFMFVSQKLPVLRSSDDNTFLSFLRYDGFASLHWFEDLYFARYLLPLMRADLRDPSDGRWVWFREALAAFTPLAQMMARTHRLWLPLVTAGQDQEDELILKLNRANVKVQERRIKKYKEER